jgi:hypothetical protein
LRTAAWRAATERSRFSRDFRAIFLEQPHASQKASQKIAEMSQSFCGGTCGNLRFLGRETALVPSEFRSNARLFIPFSRFSLPFIRP